ncbi:MAG TPA: hypothetical protein VLL03_03430, partial [Burkholderiales bacterium]|nr:hypothetical protein [Burkholderiales bacterium]
MQKKFSILGLLLLTTGAFAAQDDQDDAQPQAEQPAVEAPVEAQPALPPLDTAKLGKVRSAVVLVVGQEQEQPLYAKNVDKQMPIASITKLMTAMVVLDAQLPLDEPV